MPVLQEFYHLNLYIISPKYAVLNQTRSKRNEMIPNLNLVSIAKASSLVIIFEYFGATSLVPLRRSQKSEVLIGKALSILSLVGDFHRATLEQWINRQPLNLDEFLNFAIARADIWRKIYSANIIVIPFKS